MALTVSTKDKHQIESTYIVSVQADGWHRFQLVKQGNDGWRLYNDNGTEVMSCAVKSGILRCLREAGTEYINNLSNQTECEWA
jgi:hypothetical protein